MRSPAPTPFWMVSTNVSSRSKGPKDLAALPTPDALVAIITRSHGPGSEVLVVAWTDFTNLSPLAPSTRKPFC